MNIKHILLVILFTLSQLILSEDKIIKMGYRTTPKLPYIEGEPSNEGLFLDLFGEAARRIGYELEVVRAPKVRILEMLASGELDFYPLYSFTSDRSKFSYWIRNGIEQSDVAISRSDLPELKSTGDIEGLRYLVALGNPDYLVDGDKSRLNIVTIPELSVERALELIRLNRVDIYIYEKDTLQYFIKTNGLKGLKFQPGFYQRPYWSYTGVSRFSKLYRGSRNPNYDSTKDKSIENFPYMIDKNSIFAQFERALMELKEEGFTDKLYKKYFE